MKRYLLRLIALGVVLCMFTGCATTDGGRTRAEGTGFGALFGAAIGAGVGALVGGKKGALIGAGVGTAAGAGAGYVAGDAVAEQKEEYIKTEDELDGKINVVAQYNTDLNVYNEQTATRITELNQEVSKLNSRKQVSKAKVAERRKKRDEINSLIRDADQRKISMNNEVIALNEYIKSLNQEQQDRTKMAKLDQEVDSLRKNIAMLDSNNVQMAKLVKSLSVRK